MPTNDRTVNALVTLADMLEEQTMRAESAEKATMDAVDLSAEIARELEVSKKDLLFIERRCEELSEDLDRAHAKQRDYYKVESKAHLFDAFLADPATMLSALGYLRDNRKFVSGAKIAGIKVVREMAHLGLKEAKDFVEGYLAMTEMSPISDATDGNGPCGCTVSHDPNDEAEPARGSMPVMANAE